MDYKGAKDRLGFDAKRAAMEIEDEFDENRWESQEALKYGGTHLTQRQAPTMLQRSCMPRNCQAHSRRHSPNTPQAFQEQILSEQEYLCFTPHLATLEEFARDFCTSWLLSAKASARAIMLYLSEELQHGHLAIQAVAMFPNAGFLLGIPLLIGFTLSRLVADPFYEFVLAFDANAFALSDHAKVEGAHEVRIHEMRLRMDAAIGRAPPLREEELQVSARISQTGSMRLLVVLSILILACRHFTAPN